MWPLAALLLVPCLLVACSTPEAESANPGPLEPPNCASIKRFGNGSACAAKAGHLQACGQDERRICAAARLCFDAPEYAFCSCDKDADCGARATYINKARLVRGAAPIDAACKNGRCLGVP